MLRFRWQTVVASLIASSSLAAQASYVHFESSQVHPIRVSSDGTRLFVCNTADNRLEVYSLADVDHPVLIRDIPVGLEPVSVTPRTDDEVWVVNNLSDSISVVSVDQGCVTDTLRAKDEPADLVFANGKAFVSAAASSQVHVFDATTHAIVKTLGIAGHDPRALVAIGNHVYVLVARSGNDSTIVPASQAPPPPPPTNPNLPPAPQTGLIVSENDPTWSSVVTWTLPDQDLFEIDASSLSITRNFTALGTNNFDLAADPVTGNLFIANTDARNLVRFEANVRGHAIDSRVTRLTTGATPTASFFDLNPGVDYAVLPNPAALANALAEPTGIALDPNAARIYVAAQGTDRIGVLDLNGNIVARIEVGDTPGTLVDSAHKRGPRALALHPSSPRLYVLNRLSSSIAVIDTQTETKLAESPLAFDPIPSSVSAGRRFIYDAKLSGNGTMSCAACHVDGDLDGLSWDLGNPAGDMIQPPPNQPAATPMHPMKGPMTTQTLRGLDVPPFHWRGDRADLFAFNAGFPALLGGAQLNSHDLALVVAFMAATKFPPNPNENLDRSLKTTPAGTNQAAGQVAFNQLTSGGFSCASCHSLPTGTNGFIIPANVLQESQEMKIPELRNLYRKVGMPSGTGSGTLGFGYTHDGALANLTAFLAQPVFAIWPSSTKDDIVEYLLAFDSGEAPTVGYQVTINAANANSSSVNSDAMLLQNQVAAANCELVAHGTYLGEQHGLVFDLATAKYTSDTTGLGPFTLAQLKSQAASGQAIWTLTGVPLLSSQRIGVDRDLDSVLDGDEGIANLGGGTLACSGEVRIFANSEPSIGDSSFAVVAHGAEPFARGRVVVSIGGPHTPLGLSGLLFGTSTSADAQGFAFAEHAIPNDPSLVGAHWVARAWFQDACAPNGVARSDKLLITLQP